MECSCNMNTSADEYYSFQDVKMVKARKIHICTECGEEIKKGDEYEYFKGVLNGDWDRYKTCKNCLSLRNMFFKNGYTFCCLWDDFSVNLEEENYEIPEKCISALTSVARAKVCDLIEESWKGQYIKGL